MSTLADRLLALGIESMDGRAFAPLADEDVTRIEEVIGCELPESYAWFLRTYGQSMFSAEVNCTPHAHPLYFGWFFGSAELLLAIDCLSETLPETIIPIAEDGGGNAFCIGVSGDDRGKVYFHNHCIGWHADAEDYLRRGKEVPEDIRYQTVHLIANSFGEFILQMARRV